MRKLLALLLIISVVACKSKQVPNTVGEATSTKMDYKSLSALKGEWTISSVTYPGSEYFKVTSFDLADSKCFVGSTWKFVTNNNSGNMALTQSSCTSYTSPITWYINKDGFFVLKLTNGTKSKKVTDGYILKTANISETSFQLIDKVNVGGQMTDVVYQFNKN